MGKASRAAQVGQQEKPGARQQVTQPSSYVQIRHGQQLPPTTLLDETHTNQTQTNERNGHRGTGRDKQVYDIW